MHVAQKAGAALSSFGIIIRCVRDVKFQAASLSWSHHTSASLSAVDAARIGNAPASSSRK